VVLDACLLRNSPRKLTEPLEEQGYTVLEAENGNAALTTVASSERIDLLATDVGLPGINGRQLAEMARSLRPDLKVLFLTGYAYDAALEKKVLEPNTQLLGKPVAIEAFCAKVHGMLQSRWVDITGIGAARPICTQRTYPLWSFTRIKQIRASVSIMRRDRIEMMAIPTKASGLWWKLEE
jgi:CheY-like chemotaxis protein